HVRRRSLGILPATTLFRSVHMGRVGVTGNDDAESIRMLPTLEISNSDKLMILRAAKRDYDFPMDTDDRIARELPAFARFIYDYQDRKSTRLNCSHVKSSYA